MQNLERLTLAEMQEFLAGSRSIGFRVQGREQIYRFVERVLAAQHYRRLGRRQKGIVRRFLARLSGLSRPPATSEYRYHDTSGGADGRRIVP